MADNELITKLSELREIDFTALDYETLQKELIEYIKTAQTNNGILDNFLEGDAAKVFIDLFSYLGDLLAFRIDTQANETYLPTAQRRQSIINLLEIVGQKVRSTKASQVTLNVVPNPISRSDIEIPARTSFITTGTDGEDIQFEIMNNETDYFNSVIIPANVTNFNIRAFSGTYRTYDVISTGESNFTIQLPEFPVIEGSVKVSVTPVLPEFLTPEIIESTRAVEVDTVVSPSEDIIYRIKTDENGVTTIIFSSSGFGKIPPNGHTIHVDYRVGGGKNTNVGTNSINTTLNVSNLGGESITLTLTNPDGPASGGDDAEDIEIVRQKVPGLVRANDNLVTVKDYESIISTIPGVQDVFAVDRFTDLNVFQSKFQVPINSVFIWVLPETGGEISPDLRQIISQEIEKRRLTAIENFVFNPVYINWSIQATVNLVSTADSLAVQEEIIRNLQEKFGFETARFKRKIKRSQIISTIQNVEGVDFVELVSPSTNLDSEENEVLRLLPEEITLNIVKE